MKNSLFRGHYVPLFNLFSHRINFLSFFLCVFVGSMYAAESSSQNVKVSIARTTSSLQEVLDEIESQTEYLFIINSGVDTSKKVTVESDNESIIEVLDDISSQAGISYTVSQKHIILSKKGEKPSVQPDNGTFTVSGSVIDNKGEPLIGVSVLLTGTTQGTITDFDGKFSLDGIQEGSVLEFSYVGFISQKVKVGKSRMLSIQMQEDNQALDEVVVIGYGTMKKRDLTGSVASLKGEDLIKAPVSNAAQALQGRLPGVNVVSQDGRPDASISIRVRGGGSISQSNEPLYIVDGFPATGISDIPADMIESIDVLKDASSTAIYGARGANGVIIVTTKGAKEEKISVKYNGYVQFKQPVKYLETMDAYDYIAYNWGYADAVSDTYRDAWEMLWAIGAYQNQYNNLEGIDHYRNVGARNITKDVYGNAFSHNHNLTLSGGSENTKILFSLNHMDDEGLKINSWYKRTNASLKLDQKISKKLSFTLDSRFTQISKMGDEGTTNGSGSLLSSAYRFRPIATQDVLGELDDMVNTSLGMYDKVLQDRFNPVERIKDYKNSSMIRSLRANASLSWNIIEGLTVRSEIGLNTEWSKDKIWKGPVYSDYFDMEGNQTYGGDAEMEQYQAWNLRWANTINYDVQGLGEEHRLNILVGHEMTNSAGETMKMTGQYYPASFDADRAFAMMDQYGTLDGVVTHSMSTEMDTPDRLVSFFGRVNYSLLDRYLFTVTFRADGSSKFAPSHRWGYFPAAAFGWRISEEPFMEGVRDWLDNLKFRLSYGTVGNDGIDASLWKMNWKSSGLLEWNLNENKQLGYEPASTTMSNPDLKWETTITRNIGFDFGFFNSRLYGTLDMYWNSTKDLLMLNSISGISGFTTRYDNIGETSNKGVEISLGGDIVRTKDFNLSASINFNINRGKVEELAEGVNGLYSSNWASSSTRPGNDYVIMEGKPVGLVRGYIYDGFYTTQDFNFANGIYTLKEGITDVDGSVLGTVFGTTNNKPSGQVAYPGVPKFRDLNGDNIVNEEDATVIGDVNPDFTGGMNINGNYKNLDFSLGFNWSYGNDVYNANYLCAFYGSKEDGLYRNRLNYLNDAYRIYDIKNGQLTFVTEPQELDRLNANAKTYLPYMENAVVSTFGVQDGSYLRLNNLTIGYTFPKQWIHKAGIKNLRIYGTVYNVFTITGYKGLDPEVNSNTEQNDQPYPTLGLDWGTYPRARSYTFGVNIEF